MQYLFGLREARFAIFKEQYLIIEVIRPFIRYEGSAAVEFEFNAL
jgi:hypothetical protein